MIIIIITIVEMLIPAHHQRLAIMSANPTRLGRAPTVAALAQLSRRARTSSLRPAVASTNSIGRSSTLWARCSPIAQSQLLNRSHSTSAPAATSALPEFSAEDTYDVVIIGAGNAGLALAASLSEYTPFRSRHTHLKLFFGSLPADSVQTTLSHTPRRRRLARSSSSMEPGTWPRMGQSSQQFDGGKCCVAGSRGWCMAPRTTRKIESRA